MKQFPNDLVFGRIEEAFRDLEPLFEADRPCIVFDLSNVSRLDSAGVEFLLHSMEEAMKRNGDVKLAAVSPELSIVLEITRIAYLFEIFENCADAVESFHRFSAFTVQPPGPPAQRTVAERAG